MSRSSTPAESKYILIRQSPRALNTILRFASEPQSGAECRLLMDQWRDGHNAALTSELLKKEGKVVSATLTPALASELEAFRSTYPSWQPLAPPDGMFHAPAAWAAPPSGAQSAAKAAGDDDAAELPHTPSNLPQSVGSCYVRQPALHGNQLAFICEGDLWFAELPPAAERTVGSLSPRASRLTVDGGCAHPIFSPDGTRIAFSRTRGSGGSAELCVMGAPLGGAGGGKPATQLTFLGDDIEPVCWTPDGERIVARSAAGQPMDHMSCLCTVPAGGGRPTPLPFGVSHHLCALPGGRVLLGRETVDPAHRQWKGYRGGNGGSLWHGARGAVLTRLPLPTDWNVGHPLVHG
eukprot:473238-Prymnesium_polylepis.1